MVYIVAYDLQTPNDTPANYDLVAAAIKNIGPWARIEQSVWLVNSFDLVASVRDVVWKSMHQGDKLFVAQLSGAWGSYNLYDDVVSWLRAIQF